MISLDNLTFDYEGKAQFKVRFNETSEITFRLSAIKSEDDKNFSGIFDSPEFGEGVFHGIKNPGAISIRVTTPQTREQFTLHFDKITHLTMDTLEGTGNCISTFPNQSYTTGVEQVTLPASLKSL